jgi:hypothetical protein
MAVDPWDNLTNLLPSPKRGKKFSVCPNNPLFNDDILHSQLPLLANLWIPSNCSSKHRTYLVFEKFIKAAKLPPFPPPSPASTQNSSIPKNL